MEIEVWKDIVGYEGIYQVSNLGNVKSLSKYVGTKSNSKRLKNETILKQAVSKGYNFVTLYINGNKKPKRIHQLVVEAFLNHTPCGRMIVVNHKNFIKTDNRLVNLEIVTAIENLNKKHIKSSSEYTGVSWAKTKNKWASNIYANKRLINLGYFDNEYDAHLAYQKALNEIKKTS